MRRFRIVQVGLGRWGRNWAIEVLPQIPEVELVACVDAAPAALAEAVKAGIACEADCYSSVEAVLSACEFDALLVTTDLMSHVPVIRRAVEAGKAVLCEKPLAPTLDEAREVTELAAGMGVTLMVSQNYRFFPAVRAVQQLVRERALGRLVHIAIDFRRFSPPGGEVGHRSWAQPLLLDMSIHHFDLLRAVTGHDAMSVRCWTWNPEWAGYKDPPEGTATILFDDDLVVSYRGTWISPANPTPWAGEWRMAFEKGELWWTSRDDRMSVAGDRVDRFEHRTPGIAEPVKLPTLRYVDRAGSLAQFLHCLQEGTEPETTAQDNLASLAITYAAAESARRGEEVRLATEDNLWP